MHAPARPASSPRSGRTLGLFLVVFTLILAAGSAVALTAWDRFGPGGESGKVLGLVLLPAFLFAPTLLLSWRRRGECVAASLSKNYHIAALSLGLLSFFFLAGAATWLAGGALHLLGLDGAARAFAVAAFAGAAALTLYGVGNALFGLRVVRHDVRLRGLPEAWAGRTVALVTDVHFGHIYGRRYSARLVEKLRTLSPDLVLIGGDLFDGVEGDFDPVLEPWRRLAPPFGVHYVTGNHEEHGDREGFLSFVRRAGIRDLGGKKLDLDGLQLLGLHYGEASHPAYVRAFLQDAGLDRKRAALALVHVPHPEIVPILASEGIALSLHGHTHNGQVWPWNALARRAHGAFTYGLNPFGPESGALQVCTSSGAGSWGPPLRVGTQSEIVVLRLLSVE